MINSCEKEKRWCLGGISAFSMPKYAREADSGRFFIAHVPCRYIQEIHGYQYIYT